jgi:hypothetical protein
MMACGITSEDRGGRGKMMTIDQGREIGMNIVAHIRAGGLMLEVVMNIGQQERTNSDHCPAVIEMLEAGYRVQRRKPSTEEGDHPHPTPYLQIATEIAAIDEDDKVSSREPTDRNPPLALLALSSPLNHHPTIQRHDHHIQRNRLPPRAPAP